MCPSKHWHGAILFRVILRHRPISVAFMNHVGIWRTYSHLKPPGPNGGSWKWDTCTLASLLVLGILHTVTVPVVSWCLCTPWWPVGNFWCINSNSTCSFLVSLYSLMTCWIFSTMPASDAQLILMFSFTNTASIRRFTNSWSKSDCYKYKQTIHYPWNYMFAFSLISHMRTDDSHVIWNY